ncbi:UDP-glucosyltransferase 2-like [Prorops nasuta]|uniref:UDP-glucosyltransferase 2-like n=1 Tax=Prorops nasuta TaxID=863751 RepID=UPI0034CEB44A
MRAVATLTTFSILLLFEFFAVECFNILGICPSTSYSHQQPFLALMKALAAHGHNVTVISTIPLKSPVKNYEHIDLSFSYKTKDCTGLRHMGAFELLHKNMREANDLCEEQLFSAPIENLIKKRKKFDGVIIEQLWFQCYYALVKHYNFPVLMGFLSVGNLPYVMDSVGNPDDALLNPDMAYPFTQEMSMDERIWNVLYTTWTRIYYRYWHLPRAQRIADKWGPDVSVSDIDRNFSLVILGNNHVFGYPKPLLPNVVEVHSLQISEKQEILPKEISEFLDNATEGAIYFSLGSNLQTSQLPVGPLTALCRALSSLRQRVLWKHNGDMGIHPVNIKFVKWVPQQAVLAHPKILAYIMQGGLQSLQEAVHHSVPVVAIPFFGDQHFNARKILNAGIGLTLDVDTMTERLIVETLQEVVKNRTYRDNIRAMSAISKDELVKPMDKAVWHVEHVLKFPNSKHLRYHGRDMSYFSYYSTFLMILIYFASIVYISYNLCFIISRLLLKKIYSYRYNKLYSNIQKKE